MSQSTSESSSDEGIEAVELSKEQSVVVAGVLGAVIQYGFAVNTSQTGAGKTVMDQGLKQQLENMDSLDATQTGVPEPGDRRKREVINFIIGPGSLAPVNASKMGDGESPSPFQRECLKYGETMYYVSYESLRGSVPSASPTSSSDKVVYNTTGKTVTDVYGKIAKLPNPHPFTWMDGEKDKYGGKITNDPDDQLYTDLLTGLVVRKDVLVRKPTKPPTYKYVAEFSPSKKWMQFCLDNTVKLTIDESQKAKNKAAQNNSVAAMIRGIRRAFFMKGGSSYFVLNSATPLDKQEHSANYFALIGLHNPVMNNDMFVTKTQRTSYQCYLEAKRYNPSDAETTTCARDIALKSGVITARGKKTQIVTNNEANLNMWIKCVMATVNFSMANRMTAQVYNGFFNVTRKSDLALLDEARLELEKMTNMKGESNGLKHVTAATSKSESAMIYPMTRHALNNLNNDPLSKVVLGFTRIDSVDKCIAMFEDAGYDGYIVRIAGYSKDDDPSSAELMRRKSEKAIGIGLFQSSDTKRIIVGTLDSIATGIDLHDIQGGRQRWAYMPADPNIVRTHQFSGRFGRYGTKSVAQVFICYPKNLSKLPQAINVYKSNIKKTGVLSRTLKSRDLKGVSEETQKIFDSQLRLPGDYDRFIELPCPDMSYLMDQPVYNPHTNEYYPELGTFGFIRKNNEKGRLNYQNTAKVIDYLEEMCRRGKDPDTLTGFVFMAPFPSNFDPSDSDIIEEIIQEGTVTANIDSSTSTKETESPEESSD